MILRQAQDEVRQAELMVRPGPVRLAAAAVGDPVVGPERAEEPLHDFPGAAPGDEDGAVAVVEDPQPPVLLADPHAGLVGFDGRPRQQAGADRARLLGEGGSGRVDDVDDRALADRHSGDVRREMGEAFEGDAMGEAQVEEDPCAPGKLALSSRWKSGPGRS